MMKHSHVSFSFSRTYAPPTRASGDLEVVFSAVLLPLLLLPLLSFQLGYEGAVRDGDHLVAVGGVLCVGIGLVGGSEAF
jgi:hypothetical protein